MQVLTPAEKEYFHFFESILYGLAVTQLLVGWARLIAKYGSYKGYWAHVMFTALLLLTIVQRFFVRGDLAQFNGIETSLEFFLKIMVSPLLVFVTIFLFLPERCEGVDFRALVIKYIWLFVGSSITHMAVANYVTWEQEGWKPFMWINIAIAIVLLIFLYTKHLKIFEALAVFGMAYQLILMYIR